MSVGDGVEFPKAYASEGEYQTPRTHDDRWWGVKIALDTEEGQSTLVLFSGDFSFDETQAVRYTALENEATRYLAYIA